MVRRIPRLFMAITVTLLACQAQAQKLNTLIPGLYGGDGITLAGVDGGPFPSHAPHFLIDTADSFLKLNRTISAHIGAIPFASSGGGFAFRFDEDLGTFVQEARSFGPIYTERADTIGEGRFSAFLSYSSFDYDEFIGQPLNSLVVSTLHEPDTIDPDDVRTSFELDMVDVTMNMDIRISAMVFAGTYGVTDKFDIGFLVPFADVDMRVDARAEVIKSPDNMIPVDVHTFDGGPESPDDFVQGSARGLGDILLRAKYHFVKGDGNNFAAALQVKTASGDEDDFLGTGETTTRALMIWSRTIGAFTPHINLGYQFNFDDSGKNSLEYAAGFDVGAGRTTFAMSVIGSREINGDNFGDTILNGAVGLKFNPFGSYIVTASALLPLNNEGLRSDLIASLSLERNF